MTAPRILLIVGGGIAAYKACELVRLIRKGGGSVTCVLTDGVSGWIRDELGPESLVAERLREDTATLMRIPELVRRIEERFPAKGGAPEQPPLPDVELMWERRRGGTASSGWRYALAAAVGGAAVWGVIAMGWVG